MVDFPSKSGGAATVPEYQSGTMVAPQIPSAYTAVSADPFLGNVVYNLDIEHDITVDSIVAQGVEQGDIRFGVFEKATSNAPAALGAPVLEQTLTPSTGSSVNKRTMLSSDVAITAGSYWATASSEGAASEVAQLAYVGSTASGPGMAYPDKDGKAEAAIAFKSTPFTTNRRSEAWPTVFGDYRANCFSADGTKFFWIGITGSYYSYLQVASLSTPYDLRTAKVLLQQKAIIPNLDVLNWAGYAPRITGMGISADGTKILMYLVQRNGSQKAAVLQASLSTPYDIDTLSFDPSEGVDLFEITETPRGDGWNLTFKSDGTEFWIGDGGRTVYRYTLSAAWDASTVSSTWTDSWTMPENGNDSSYFTCVINPDTGKIIVCNTSYYGHSGKSFYFYEYSVTPGNAAINTVDSVYLGWSNWDTRGWHAVHAGNYLYFGPLGSGSYYQFNLPTPFDLTGISQVGSVTSMTTRGDWSKLPSIPYGSYRGATVAKDGDEYWAFHSDGRVGVFPLGTKYDLASMDIANYSDYNIIRALGLSTDEFTACTTKITEDGTKLFVSTNHAQGGNAGWIYRFDFGTPWDLSTLSNPNVKVNIGALNSSIQQINNFCISADGKHMYVIYAWSTRQAFKFEMSTAFDLNTVVAAPSKNRSLLGALGMGGTSSYTYYNIPLALEFGPDLKSMFFFFKKDNETSASFSRIKLEEDANLNGPTTYATETITHNISSSSQMTGTSFQFVGTDFKRALITDDSFFPTLWEFDNSRDANVYMKQGTKINGSHNGLPLIYLGVK